ncbi:RNA methyltransferase [Accumulibacter sp.]|uniref:TrmH family RNA methyltransferase n=1 Tax=Accumulibacter sp. TaxID=2053492 RepID=UPI0025E279B0|nr:RNA methyltransferase [Accumulibacter sp.]MCM8611855.1 RNA methyltransferase [Accumulibacter sp.]MCM8635477.1 RNA methyltransferase [Accumulibacter sp.]MCM8639055.1 RNA methyltransferase [Accumulibacter sp.]
MKRISSRDNAHYRELKRLHASARERRRSGRLLLDGMHLITAYQQRCGSPLEIVISDSAAGRREVVDHLANCPPAIPVTQLPDALWGELALVDTPSGIMAVAAWPQPATTIDLAADTVVLDGVQDPGNVGSILRSAAAAGFQQILLSADCAQAWSPKTLRAGMGAHFQLAIHEGGDLPAFLTSYHGQSIATAVGAAADLYSAGLAPAVAWVFGSEGQGLRAAVLAATQLQVSIPMPGDCESLNVAAAAAVCLFETVRRRHPAADGGG